MTFSLKFSPHGRQPRKGDHIAVEFPDGKGVSAVIADVDIEPGGSTFAIICTQDGTVAECTCPPNGIDALTVANADLIHERDHLREQLAVLVAQRDEAEKAATRWEGMYRNLAEMQPDGITPDAKQQIIDALRSVGGADLKLNSEQIVVNLYMMPKEK